MVIETSIKGQHGLWDWTRNYVLKCCLVWQLDILISIWNQHDSWDKAKPMWNQTYILSNAWPICYDVNHQANTQWYSNRHQVCCKDLNFSNCYIHYNFMCNKKFPCRLIELLIILLLWQEYDCLLFRLDYYKALWFTVYSETKNEHRIHVTNLPTIKAIG